MDCYISLQLEKTKTLITAMLADKNLLTTVAQAAQACVSAFQAGRKILLAGNGGSAADAQHIAGELVGRFAFDRVGLPAIALTTDTSIMTAVANDYGYAQLFARQLQAQGQSGDVFIAYSTSGQSTNIINALQVAKATNITTIGMTGAGKNANTGPMLDLCDYVIAVPSTETPKIQEGHLVIGHILCGLIEDALFANNTKGHKG